ncbi:MAG: Thiamine-phosphate synthase [Alphaproteobacteria bacterium MarineAlpha2_Bin1]|nr:MAG: Thiamine-phosphate synthase [Alphaproteobacteria bacterium MarineAlpha2_Bin1]
MEKKFGIYLITPEKINLKDFREKFQNALETNRVSYVQLRLKNCSDEIILETANGLLEITKKFDVPLLINDRPDIAKKSGANGVHIGQYDYKITEAREMLGRKLIIGVTCHNSIDLACEAVNSGANYVAFGAFYRSITKKTDFQAELSILNWWRKISNIPCVAIGGITQNNFNNLITHGANYLAVISSIWKNPKGPAFALNEYFKESSE